MERLNINTLLPKEMHEEILSRSPVKSLLRFRCVSKAWCRMISHRDFSLKHATRQILIRIPQIPPMHKIHAWDGCNGEKIVLRSWNDELETFTPRDHPEAAKVLLLTSYMGLLLFNIKSDIYLFNPTTRRCKVVLTHPCLASPLSSMQKNRFFAGMCYDPLTDDYKVVIGIRIYKKSIYFEAEVASLKTRAWKKVDMGIRRYLYHSQAGGVVVDGKIHWLLTAAHGEHALDSVITCFDPTSNDDKLLELVVVENVKRGILGLGELDGCLCMVRCKNEVNSYQPQGPLDLWAMKKGSWTILYTVEMNFALLFLQPLSVTKDGQLLFYNVLTAVKVYDPSDDSCNDIVLPRTVEGSRSVYMNAFAYQESLYFPL